MITRERFDEILMDLQANNGQVCQEFCVGGCDCYAERDKACDDLEELWTAAKMQKSEEIIVTHEMIEAGLEFYPCRDDKSEFNAYFLESIYRSMRGVQIKNTVAVTAK